MNPDDALALQRAIEVLQRQSSTAAPSPTVAELHAQYEPWYRAHNKSYRSAFVPRWNHLLPYFKDRTATSITLGDADAYRGHRVLAAPGSRNCELNSLKACFAWAVKRKLVAMNPLAGLEEEPAPNVRTAFLDEAGFARLQAAAPNPMAAAIFLTAFDTGMRRSEMLNLKREQVDLDQRLITIGDGETKNGSGRVVPFTARLADVLRALPAWSTFMFSLDGGPVQRSTLHRWFAAAREKSGIPAAMTFHGLRHSCSTLMRRRGVPWPLAKVALGWKTEAMAHRYQQFSAEDWTSLRERMDAGIAVETRKPPLRSIPENHQPSPDVVSSVKGMTLK